MLPVEAGAGAAHADRVQLVDEHDRRSVLARLLEEPANSGRAEPGEHLDECGGALRVERGAAGVGDRLREQRLPRPGRTVEQDSLRDAGAERAEALRVLEEVDDLLQLGRRLVHARDVLPCDGRLRVRLHLRRLHARHERDHAPDEVDHQAQEDERKPREGEVGKVPDPVEHCVHRPSIGAQARKLKRPVTRQARGARSGRSGARPSPSGARRSERRPR